MGSGSQSGSGGGKGLVDFALNPAGAILSKDSNNYAAAYDPIGQIFGSGAGEILDPGGTVTRRVLGAPTREEEEANRRQWEEYYRRQAETERENAQQTNNLLISLGLNPSGDSRSTNKRAQNSQGPRTSSILGGTNSSLLR